MVLLLDPKPTADAVLTIKSDDSLPFKTQTVMPSKSATDGTQESSGQPASASGRLPESLIKRYVGAAVRRACTEELDAGGWYAEIPMLPGVWADGSSASEARSALADVVEGWLLFKIEDHDGDIPVIDTIDLNWL